MQTNRRTITPGPLTHESAPAYRHLSNSQALRRSVLSCLLGEDEFYEDGTLIKQRIRDLALALPPAEVAALATEARNRFHLRHVPLWLLVALARTASGTSLLSETIPKVVQRADELAEFCAQYWAANPDKDITAQMKKGLARAFEQFGEYHFAKYDREKDVKLRDVMRLTHPRPADETRSALYKRVIERTLETPDTWEVELSSGADKRATFERLIAENKLGYLALLRNLRNMEKAGCDRALVNAAIEARRGAARVLPFRYVAAARAAPAYEPALDKALLAGLAESPKLPGRTVLLVDVSGSMEWKLSAKSDLNRIDAAATLASIVTGDDVRCFTFSNELVEVPRRLGMAGVDVIKDSQPHGSTMLGASLTALQTRVPHDRLIVVTDEQSHDKVPEPKARQAYMINVASNRNGVGYGRWTHIDGMSESVLHYIREIESM